MTSFSIGITPPRSYEDRYYGFEMLVVVYKSHFYYDVCVEMEDCYQSGAPASIT